jgi:hypothetical protein
MNEDTREGLTVLVSATLFVFVFIFLTAWITVFVKLNYTNSKVVNVYVDNAEVFTGKIAMIDVTTGGAATTLTVYEKLFPIPKVAAMYTSKNIEVRSEEQ